MESDKIEQLLEKYFEATTTVAEEEVLRSYFLSGKVASHLEQYTAMFAYFSKAKEERYTKQVLVTSRSNWYAWASVAAMLVFMSGLYFNSATETTDNLEEVYTAEEIASAQEAFALLAMNFNKGTEQINHLEEFQISTNKFLIKE